MDKQTFEKINSYCDGKNISQIERDFVIRKFSESLFNAIETKEAQQGFPLTHEEINTIKEPLLNDVNLDNSIVAAKYYHTTVEEQFFLQFKKNNRNNNFWTSVFTGITANAIYSLLLILAFILGKDLISSWLNTLLNK